MRHLFSRLSISTENDYYNGKEMSSVFQDEAWINCQTFRFWPDLEYLKLTEVWESVVIGL